MQLAIIGHHGVINDAPEDGGSTPAGWRPIRGSLEAIARLHRAGWHIIVASNKPGLADGTLLPDSLVFQHASLRRHVADSGGAIEAFCYCPHAPSSGCNCHLPATGLLEDIATRLHITLDSVPVIGDSLSYIQAALASGARPILVKTGKGSATASQPGLDPAVAVFNDLYSAVDFLLKQGHLTADR
jgi:D-glycero-D-manno-heptose 1,7-bisphosphate phosphatase